MTNDLAIDIRSFLHHAPGCLSQKHLSIPADMMCNCGMQKAAEAVDLLVTENAKIRRFLDDYEVKQRKGVMAERQRCAEIAKGAPIGCYLDRKWIGNQAHDAIAAAIRLASR